MAHATEPRGGRRRRWPSGTRDARGGRCWRICRSGGGKGRRRMGWEIGRGMGKVSSPRVYGDGVLQVGVFLTMVPERGCF